MNNFQKASIFVAAASVAAFSVWGACGLTKHVIVAVDKWGDAAPTQLVSNITKASNAQAESMAAIERDLRVELWHVDRVMNTLDGTLKTSQEVIGGFSSVSTALTSTVSAGTDLLASAKKTTDTLPDISRNLNLELTKIQESTTDLDTSVKSFNALLTRPGLGKTIDGLGDTSQNISMILADFHFWSHPILHPDPCTTDKCRMARIFNRVQGLAGFGSAAFDVSRFFSPLNVHVQH